jgi:hypothetical protein
VRSIIVINRLKRNFEYANPPNVKAGSRDARHVRLR